MGRLPDTFAGAKGAPQRVTMRTPYTIASSLTLPSSTSGVQFPPDVFTHSVDRPFEIHRVIPRAYLIDDEGLLVTAQPAIDELLACVGMRISDFGKTQELSKSSTPVINTVKGTTDLTWEWAEPYFLVKDEGLVVALDSLVYPFDDGTSLRVDIAFQGFLLTLAPASDRR